MSVTHRRRWSDNDRYFGPLTIAWSPRYRSLSAMLSSSDDEDRGASLRATVGALTILVALPDWLLRPHRRWVDTSKYAWSQNPRGGYWDIHRCEYGFSFSGTGMVGETVALHVRFGPQTMDSTTEKSKCFFLPWTKWRHVRHSLYDLDGALYAHLPAFARWNSPERTEQQRIEEACPTAVFAFKDYDGEELTVTTKIEEREWRAGEGWFKWLAWFRPPIVHRTLDLRFSGETGKRKGSWKGGTLGHAIEMRPGELHAEAFERYCAEHDMIFLGPVADPAVEPVA